VQITNRLERNRLRQGPGETDSRTGLAGWPQLELELRRLLAMAARYGQLLAVAVLAVDTPSQPEGRYGPAAGQAVRLALGRLLRRSFRIEDAVGERADEHLVVALYGAEPAGAIERLASILETFRAEQITFEDNQLQATASAGLATYPVDGARVDALVDAATTALATAQSMGGDRVQTVAGDEPSPYGSVDVLLVDDDDALAPLLLHALSTRGYRTHWLRDGAEAAALLLAPDGLRARVILLDVGLPGLDGLSVLRELANARTLDRCRVIMVTLRSNEQEVLQALELGAFDHVAKPLSIPVLLHRVRHAIESLRA
jgi:diguanylate cyclase (GGDEF)-like protein